MNQVLLDTVNKDVLSGSGVDAATFWASVERALDTQRIVPFQPPMLRSRQRSRVQTSAVSFRDRRESMLSFRLGCAAYYICMVYGLSFATLGSKQSSESLHRVTRASSILHSPPARPPSVRSTRARGRAKHAHAPARACTHMHTYVHAGELWIRSVAGARRLSTQRSTVVESASAGGSAVRSAASGGSALRRGIDLRVESHAL